MAVTIPHTAIDGPLIQITSKNHHDTKISSFLKIPNVPFLHRLVPAGTVLCMRWVRLVFVRIFHESMTAGGIINNDFSSILCACYGGKVMILIDIDCKNQTIFMKDTFFQR